MPTPDRRASGCLYGLAFGDALGAPTEFMGYPAIAARYGPAGPRELDGDPARVTDDTQMTLAVADALLAAGTASDADRLQPPLRERFLDWWRDPDNDRAPGVTCLDACARLADGRPWQRATGLGSKGCGANMRVAPVGLVPGVDDDWRAGAAQLQAGMTHGHPTALAASELTALAVHRLRTGTAPAELPSVLRDRCRAERSVYRADWLGDLWQRPAMTSPAEFIARGWDECLDALDRLDRALAAADRDADPCEVTGAGWVAEEALATGLLCFLLFPDDPVSAIARGAASSGDSDSIACLAGAFAGATHGLAGWPSDWPDRVEYRIRLERYGRAWD